MTTQRKFNRRRFLIGAGVSIVALGGAGAWAVQMPPIAFIERSYGDVADGGAVLVAYASQYGSTGGVAEVIAQALYKAGVPADVRRVEGVADLSSYRAAIIGAPVISDAWMPTATSFVERNRAALARIPTAYFLTCMTLALSPEPAASAAPAAALAAVQARVPEVRPVEQGLFAGALDYGKMSPAMQGLYRLFAEDDTDGDYRDFAAVGAWAAALRPRLLA